MEKCQCEQMCRWRTALGTDVHVAGGWVEWASNQRTSVCINVASREGVVSSEKDFCECEYVQGPAKESCLSTDVADRRGDQ